jgi:hypothetical protein
LFPSLQDVFSLTGNLLKYLGDALGSIAAFPICFIIPATCYIRLVLYKHAPIPIERKISRQWLQLLAPGIVILIGTVAMCIGVVTSIQQLIADFHH